MFALPDDYQVWSKHVGVRPKLYLLPTQRIVCVLLRTNSDYFPIQHELFGFYNRDGVCLLRGTDWVFKCNIS
jgi:hypothetical protein